MHTYSVDNGLRGRFERSRLRSLVVPSPPREPGRQVFRIRRGALHSKLNNQGSLWNLEHQIDTQHRILVIFRTNAINRRGTGSHECWRGGARRFRATPRYIRICLELYLGIQSANDGNWLQTECSTSVIHFIIISNIKYTCKNGSQYFEEVPPVS